MAKDKPYYPHKPIGSIDALAKSLGVIPGLLKDMAENTSKSYIKFTVSGKNGKKDREVYEPKFELKRIQKRINSRIFESIEFPTYLQGGIKDDLSPRDYIKNSVQHAGSKSLIGLDIKNFYPNIREEHVLSLFKNLFNFPDDVSSLLTSLVTLEGRVPQGACTSSYIANLVFFNSEYKIVSALRNKGLTYTRLLDDITISSAKLINQECSIEHIKSVAGLVKKLDLRLNNTKTKIERSDDLKSEYEVTGVWVGHGIPKLRKSDRKYIRQLVYICEKEADKSISSDEYHKLWNRVSGQVAKCTRLGHPQAKDYRLRLSKILPTYDETTKNKLISDSIRLIKKPLPSHNRISVINAYRKTIYALGILSRTDRSLSKNLRRKLQARFANLPSKAEMWD